MADALDKSKGTGPPEHDEEEEVEDEQDEEQEDEEEEQEEEDEDEDSHNEDEDEEEQPPPPPPPPPKQVRGVKPLVDTIKVTRTNWQIDRPSTNPTGSPTTAAAAAAHRQTEAENYDSDQHGRHERDQGGRRRSRGDFRNR